ncbi:MAG: glycogen synthase GlgA [Burkholderiaceae bacterium]|nr:glycogen synthase GlgA [Burkholderiaceae bacterium]
MSLNILVVASEAFPMAKTGGLGDAVSGMAAAIAAAGSHVTLMLPAYPDAGRQVSGLKAVAKLNDLPGGSATVLSGRCKTLGVPVLLLEHATLYQRHGVYADEQGVDYADNAIRFAALSQAAARVAQGLPGVSRPDVVHSHDWHTALTSLYMHQLGVVDVKTVLTLHNVAFQGVYPMSMADALGITPAYCTSQCLEFWGQLNFLKAGIQLANKVTVVSRHYAREILTPQFGCGLEGVLADKGADLIAIPNGIDMATWNPAKDSHLHKYRYSVDKMANKAKCKRSLQASFGLQQDAQTMLLAMGSRLTSQKMADVVVQVLPMVLDDHPKVQVAILGKGDKQIEAGLHEVASRYPGRCAVHIGYNEAQAHQLHAGADVLLHGSRFEPFGLTPLYAMRYGTVPICSRVGGMVDTIIDPGWDDPNADMSFATGLLFSGDAPADMSAAIDRAIALKALPALWQLMQRNGMSADFGWSHVAPLYVRCYHDLCATAASNPLVETSTEVGRLGLARRDVNRMGAIATRVRGATSLALVPVAAPNRTALAVVRPTRGASLV